MERRQNVANCGCNTSACLKLWGFLIWNQTADDKASKDELVKCLHASPSAELIYDMIWMTAKSEHF